MNLPAWFAGLWMALATALIAQPQSPDEIASQILAPLLDPARIATLKGDRPVNTRLYRILGWLETARLTGGNPDKIISTAQAIHGSSNTRRAVADRVAILRSWKELERFGCFTPQGITTVKKGRSPTITRGEHAGDSIHIDHILPRSIAPKLDSRFYNLIPVPSKVNQRKGAKITAKELKLAERWNRQGLLFREGLATLRAANATGALSTSRTGALLK